MHPFIHRFVAAVAAVSLLVSGSFTYAADMPVKAAYKAPAPIVLALWNGWYVGVSGGWGWGDAQQTDVTPFNSGVYDTDGGLIGATLGYNWQNGSLVFGAETDLSYSWIKGSAPQPPGGNCGGAGLGRCESEINTLGTVRGRVGYAFGNFLPYVTGGLAYAHVHGEEGDVPPTAFGSGSKWVAGWTAGVGIEGKVNANWSAKAEFLYIDLGDPEVFSSNVLGTLVPQTLSETAKIFRVGLNYHF
jgi:outer membrane immunogenic protein